jgi:hypothetical protein
MHTPTSAASRIARVATSLLVAALILTVLAPAAQAPAVANGCPAAATAYAGGVGSASDPYEISTTAELIRLAATPADWAAGTHFVQTADIDLTGCTWSMIGPSWSDRFRGSFDGGNRQITGLSMSTTGNTGFFGAADSTATLKNIRLVSVSVTSTGNNVGGLVAESSATIIDSSVSGTVNGAGFVGGLVAYLYDDGTITGSSSSATVVGTGEQVGGLVGAIEGAVVRSSATGTVTAPGRVGGLVGLTNGGTISYSYATGNVTVSGIEADGGTGAGGLVGENTTYSNYTGPTGTIRDSYATGTVAARAGFSGSGGLVGFNDRQAIIDSYARGAVTGGTDIGALVGKNHGSITDSASVTTPAVGSSDYVDTVYDPGVGDFVSTPRSGTATGLFSATQVLADYQTAGWKIVAGWAAFDAAVANWGICSASYGGYPYLLWQESSALTDCDAAGGDGDGGSGAGGSSESWVPTSGGVPQLGAGEGQWQREDGTVVPLTVSSPGSGQVRYSTDGLRVTLTGGGGSSASRGLVADQNGEIVCEVCAEIAADGVVEAWMFSIPRLVAAHRVEDLPCQTFSIPVGRAARWWWCGRGGCAHVAARAADRVRHAGGERRRDGRWSRPVERAGG